MSKTAMPAGEGDPGAGFEGRIGRTLGESLPHWRAPRRPPAGSPNVVVILFDDLSCTP